jgi:CDP-glycerol glycerophosphotransferase
MVLSKPEVSVVVIAYNEAHRLPRAVASVVERSLRGGGHRGLEDASTDSTARVTEQLSAGHPDRVTVIRQLMTHGHDGLIVAPGNTIEFAAAVDRLMSDDRLRHTLGEAASESVRRFTVEAVLQRRESQFALLQR